MGTPDLLRPTHDRSGIVTATALAPRQTIPFSRLLKVELRKSYDTRASFWLLMTIGIVVALAELIALIVGATHRNQDISWLNYTEVAAFTTAVLLPVLGIMLVTSEWSQRTAMITFTLEPRRSLVIWAKLAVGIVLTLVTAALALGIGLVCCLISGLWGQMDLSFGVDRLVGFVLSQSLAMISGFALAALVLNTAAAIVLFFAYSYVLPTLFVIGNNIFEWFSHLSPWIDFQNAQNPIVDWDMSGSDWGHLLVSGFIWLGIPLIVGLDRILKAEVK
jgi:ABC-2 type transport system permease protein